jgi:hypothetical protein
MILFYFCSNAQLKVDAGNDLIICSGGNAEYILGGYLDISVILTPCFGDIAPPHRLRFKEHDRTDNITVFFLNYHLAK